MLLNKIIIFAFFLTMLASNVIAESSGIGIIEYQNPIVFSREKVILQTSDDVIEVDQNLPTDVKPEQIKRKPEKNLRSTRLMVKVVSLAELDSGGISLEGFSKNEGIIVFIQPERAISYNPKFISGVSDLIFINRSGEIIDTQPAINENSKEFSVKQKVYAILHLGEGSISRFNIKQGDKLIHRNFSTNSKPMIKNVENPNEKSSPVIFKTIK